MNPRLNKSVTLLELLIAITLMSLVVLAFSSIDLFSRYHVITADRRAKLQNEATYVLEHMTKEISKAVGDINQNPIGIGAGTDLYVTVDANQNGKLDAYPADYRIVYSWSKSPSYEMRYYPNYDNNSNYYETIAKRISSFIPTYVSSNNYIDIQLSLCWDPDGSPVACGTPDNPGITMNTRIKMPAVSTH